MPRTQLLMKKNNPIINFREEQLLPVSIKKVSSNKTPNNEHNAVADLDSTESYQTLITKTREAIDASEHSDM
jgi:hypothetical protein